MESAPNSPWLDRDELEVVRSFLDAGVRFVVVGGRAVQFHGHARPAKDLDLLVEPSAENWPRLQAALRPLNVGVPPFEELSPERKYQARLHFYETVELLTAIDGVSFADAWRESIETEFAGLNVRGISRAHLIVSKRRGNRQLDADDIKALQDI
jgi:predicted nucleotidyltransferase